MEDEVCLYNQTGFCKFRNNCRKMHDNAICHQDHDFKSTRCTLRHPKVCRSFESEGKCKFKEDCAYKHIVNKESEMSIKHAQDVVNLQQQLHNMMLTIHQMNDKIKFLEEAIENIVKTNIEEIVAVVASSIESKKKSDNKNV